MDLPCPVFEVWLGIWEHILKSMGWVLKVASYTSLWGRR